MDCPKCGRANPPEAIQCEQCKEPFAEKTIATIVDPATGWSATAPAGDSGDAFNGLAALGPGMVLGGRYEILQCLGQGGMGAVYQATDRELDRPIALKVIRPDLASQSEILQRFKQELILARKVTHKNVIRIFDLGQAHGIKFITMEYLEGEDLKRLLRADARFSVERTVEIMRQVCLALEAAHAEGVVHRDLKPSNIMLDGADKVTVMDFGIAHSMEMTGMTRTGAVIGTPEYMSPEQAMGRKIDARSDLFSMGLIFYEMLTGKNPFESDTFMGTLVRRTQEQATPPSEVDSSIPPVISAIVAKCLETEPEARYQSAREVIDDLDTGQPPPRTRTVLSPKRRGFMAAAPLKWSVAGAALMLLVIGGYFAREWWYPGAAAEAKPVSVLVADFENETSDPVFDGTLEPIVNVALEGAPFVTAYRRAQARRIAGQLKPGASVLDLEMARLVAVREGISAVVTGAISLQGNRYGIKVNATDAVTGSPIAAREAGEVQRGAVMAEIGRLVAPIRRALGDTTPESAQLAAAETFTAANLDAAHTYSVAQDLLDQGKSEEAIKYYLSAVQLDPNLGRAYAGLAVASLNLKRRDDAAAHYKTTLSLLDRMTEREKHRTLGTYYSAFQHNYPQAIEAYRKLVFLFPGDGAGWNNLSIAQVFTLNIPEALAASRRALEINPGSLQYRLNYALYSMYGGDFDTAIAEARRILKENPAYEFAWLPLALSTLGRGDVRGARDEYARFEKVSPYGFSMAKMGEADLEMYLGRYEEALEPLRAGIEADAATGSTGEMALKLVAEAEVRLALGRTAQAAGLAEKAAAASRADSVLLPAARVLIAAGQEAKARAIADTLNGMLQAQTRSYARLIAGEIALRNRRMPEAVESFQEAQKLHNSWLSRFLLGRTYMEAERFPEALAEFEVCRNRRGETTDLFFADTTTIRHLPPLYYWLGRAQEGTGMKAAALESYREFLKYRAEALPADPLAEDARRRVGR